MNKKGFTLIELLAVIVVLAIIALIAVPISLSIINSTKAKATLRTANFYLNAVKQSVAQKSLTLGDTYSPNVCEVKEDGNLLCDGTETLEVKVKGEKPSDGTITFEEGKITSISLNIDNKVVVKNVFGKLTFEEDAKVKLVDYIRPRREIS